MKYRLMGIIECPGEKGIETRFVGKHEGKIVNQELTNVKNKVNEKWVKDRIAKELKLKTSDIHIPEHIKQAIERKE